MRASPANDEQCQGCARLSQDMARLREASESRARDDHDRCVALFAHMERLARINQSVLDDGAGRDGYDGEASHCQAAEGREKSTYLPIPDERVERLQGIVMEQARELERLRRRASSHSHRRHSKGDSPIDYASYQHLHDNQSDEREGVAVGARAASRVERTATSLHAQLSAKDRRIHELEVTLRKMEAQIENARASKLEAARTSQRQLGLLRQQTRKYEAYMKNQQREMQLLERKQTESRQYIDVLERELVGGRDTRTARRDSHPLRSYSA